MKNMPFPTSKRYGYHHVKFDDGHTGMEERETKISPYYKEEVLSKYFGLFILLLLLFSISHQLPKFRSENTLNSWDMLSCGVNRDPASQMPFSSWTVSSFKLPIYSTHDLDKLANADSSHMIITHAIIIQHGNLRNANDYFCSAVNSFKSHLQTKANLNDEEELQILQQTIIVAPIFLVDGDLCWEEEVVENLKLKSIDLESNPPVRCNYPIWSNEGWKDGHLSLPITNVLAPSNPTSSPSSSNTSYDREHQLFSYEVFNLLIKRLTDKVYFPSMKNVTLFGFSAGAQTLSRYAVLPLYQDGRFKNEFYLKFVISDPSTYLYFNNQRPRPHPTLRPQQRADYSIEETADFDFDFGVPDSSWLPSYWNINVNNNSAWIYDWEVQCSSYNQWRYGLEQLSGYFEHHLPSAEAKKAAIADFLQREVVFLIGTADTVNCKLHTSQNCNDNELATYCQAMLQGDERVDRALKYRAYLNKFYGLVSVHNFVLVQNISHDPSQMLGSRHAGCIVFGLC